MISEKQEIIQKIKDADAILIGASNGLSITEGLHLFANNATFQRVFGDFQKKYGLRNILEGYFYPWKSLEEKWAFMSRLGEHFSVHYTASASMEALKKLIDTKPYFIVTSNGEGHFELAGFDPEKIYEVEGNWIEMQCSAHCHPETYPTLDLFHEMAMQQTDCKVPSELIPVCPKCQAPMITYDASIPKASVIANWEKFLQENHGKKLVILELGIGWRNQLIKGPLMQLTAREPNATYITINLGEIYITENIKDKSYGLDGYLEEILNELADEM